MSVSRIPTRLPFCAIARARLTKHVSTLVQQILSPAIVLLPTPPLALAMAMTLDTSRIRCLGGNPLIKFGIVPFKGSPAHKGALALILELYFPRSPLSQTTPGPTIRVFGRDICLGLDSNHAI